MLKAIAYAGLYACMHMYVCIVNLILPFLMPLLTISYQPCVCVCAKSALKSLFCPDRIISACSLARLHLSSLAIHSLIVSHGKIHPEDGSSLSSTVPLDADQGNSRSRYMHGGNFFSRNTLNRLSCMLSICNSVLPV